MGDNDRVLWVGNISEKVTDDILYELFLQAGPLDRVNIPKGKDGTQRNFGFVTFKHAASVSYAMNIMKDIKLFGRDIALKTRNNAVLEHSGIGLLPHSNFGTGIIPPKSMRQRIALQNSRNVNPENNGHHVSSRHPQSVQQPQPGLMSPPLAPMPQRFQGMMPPQGVAHPVTDRSVSWPGNPSNNMNLMFSPFIAQTLDMSQFIGSSLSGLHNTPLNLEDKRQHVLAQQSASLHRHNSYSHQDTRRHSPYTNNLDRNHSDNNNSDRSRSYNSTSDRSRSDNRNADRSHSSSDRSRSTRNSYDDRHGYKERRGRY